MQPNYLSQNPNLKAQQSPTLRIRKWFLLFFISVCSCHTINSNAQTTLAAGDIAVVGLNSTNPDMFSFVLLKAITTNTVIHFTDNGFTANTTTRTGEGFLTYTAPSNIAAGTVITWFNGMTITGTGFNSNSPSSFAFNGSGDQLFIFQGSTVNWSSLSGITLLYGINYSAALSSTSSASNTLQPAASILASTSFLNVSSSTNANGYFANGSSSQTAVSVSGAQSALLALVVDAGKWFGTAASAATFPTYTLTVNSATISTTGSLSEVNTTYGAASSTTSSYTVSGSSLTNDITISAPTGFEISKTSSGSGYASSQTLTPSGGTVSSTTIYVRLSATATVAGSPYSGQITHTSSGASVVNVATASSTVSALSITSIGATAQNKNYDGNNAATILGATAVGMVNGDDITIDGGGTFASINAGTAISVTAALTLSGVHASSYTLLQPTGLSANIIPANQTIFFILSSPQSTFESPIALNGTASSGLAITYNSSNTSVATINGSILTLLADGTTTITASQAGNGNYNSAISVQVLLTVNTPTLTEVIFPQYIQGLDGANANRVPFTAYVMLGHLSANATYRYFPSMVNASDASTSNGVGNCIFPDTAGFTRSTNADLSSTGNYGTMITDANGSYSGWFVLEPTGDARFTPGSDLYMRIMLNDGSGGTSVAMRLTTVNTVKVINLVASSGVNNGTGLRGNSSATSKNFIVVYDHVSGTGRPIAASFVESDGTINTTSNSYASFYSSSVENVSGAYGMIIPNTNANGIRRIEQRSLSTGALLGCAATDADGVWPGGANTVNPTGGTTALVITASDALLWSSCTSSSSTTNGSSCDSYSWAANGQTYTIGGTYTYTTSNWCGCDSTSTLNLTIHASTSNSITVNSCGVYLWPLNGQTYTNSGTYTSTSTNTAGCPHTETLIVNLTSTTSSSNHTGCDALTVDNIIYTSSGYHSHHYTTSTGCDSIHTYYVTIYYSNSWGSVHTACNTLTIGGQTYTTSGTYPTTFTNFSGCDSIHNYYVIIKQSNTGSSNHTGCNTITLEGQTFTNSGSYSTTFTNFSGCDSIHTYHVSIEYSNTGSSTHVACNGFMLDGINYNSSGYHTHQYTNISGCDSLHTYHVTINYGNTGGSAHSACNTITIGGQTYTTSGIYSATYSNAAGCDSLHSYYVTIKHSNTGQSNQTGCNTVQIGGQTFTSSGSSSVSYTNVDGCDSVHTYSVIINHDNAGISTHTGCDALVVDGINYSSDGYHTNIFTNAYGCDSVHTFSVNINYSNSGSSSEIGCDELILGGVTYSLSGSYTQGYTNTSGCDSIHTYNVAIQYSNSGNTYQTACDELMVDGITYTSSGSHSQGYMNASGCDSLHTYYVTIHASTTNTTTATACDSYTWTVNGITYTTGGIKTATSTNAAGCSHTETLNLTIHSSTSNMTSATGCNSYTWTINGMTYTIGGTKTVSSMNAAGCSHIDTLNLTINYSTVGITTATSCGNYVWSGPFGNGNTYTSSNNTAIYVTTNASGCSHTQGLNLTVNQSTTSSMGISACNSYTWGCNGQTYSQSGTYTCVTTNAAGCSHVSTLNLTIHSNTSSTVYVVACNSYTWGCNGQTYSQSGTYTCTNTNSAGCTQTTTLNLTIHNSSSSTSSVTACNNYTWGCNGQTYFQSGTYTCISTNSVGCSHASILYLTINQSTSSSVGISTCNSYTWGCNGQTFTESGAYTCATTNAIGCSHVSTLNLIINGSTNATINVDACNNYTWGCNGQTYTQSGTYTCTSTNSAGCIQTTTLNLSIHSSTSSTASVTACNSYTWACNGLTYSQSGTYTCMSTNSAGCSHVSILYLSINQSTTSSLGISACSSYTWGCNGQTYTQSGTYTCVTTNPAGCQHVNMLNVTIKLVPMVAASNMTACTGSPVTLAGSPSGGTFSLPNPYIGSANTFTYYYTGSNGCSGSAIGSITYLGLGSVSNITVSNITSSTAFVSWVGYGVWFDVRYRTISSSTWTNAASTISSPKLITGLTGSTIYTVEVRSYCDRNSSPSTWVGTTFNTTTVMACETPIPSTTTSITKSSAKLNWNHPGTSYYTIRYKLTTSSTWISVGASTSAFKLLSGLLVNSPYEYQVKAVCANSYTSGWSVSGFFTTLASKLGEEEIPELTVDFSIFPNPTQDELNIIFPVEHASTAVLRLVDMSGRTVKMIQLNTMVGYNELSISLGDLSNGIYSLQIMSDEQVILTTRVIKN